MGRSESTFRDRLGRRPEAALSSRVNAESGKRGVEAGSRKSVAGGEADWLKVAIIAPRDEP